jgi:hypothetical protein
VQDGECDIELPVTPSGVFIPGGEGGRRGRFGVEQGLDEVFVSSMHHCKRCPMCRTVSDWGGGAVEGGEGVGVGGGGETAFCCAQQMKVALGAAWTTATGAPCAGR